MKILTKDEVRIIFYQYKNTFNNKSIDEVYDLIIEDLPRINVDITNAFKVFEEVIAEEGYNLM